MIGLQQLKELQSRELADRRQLDDQRLLRSVDEARDRLSGGPGIGIGSSRFFTAAGLDHLKDGQRAASRLTFRLRAYCATTKLISISAASTNSADTRVGSG